MMKKLIVLWVFILLLVGCSRPSGRERLEKITEIQLPAGFTVLACDYRQLGGEYFLQYDIRFNQDSARQMLEAIQASKYYAAGHAQLLYDSVWYQDGGLYKFEAMDEKGIRKYYITFNPASGLLQYSEYSEHLKL